MDGYGDVENLINQFMGLVNVIISATIILIIITVIIYLIPNLTKKGSRQSGLNVLIKDIHTPVSSITTSQGNLVVKTVDNRLYVFNTPVSINLDYYFPYRSIGLAMFALSIIILGLDLSWGLISDFIPSQDVRTILSSVSRFWFIPLIVSTPLIFIFKRLCLVIALSNGVINRFTRLNIDFNTLEKALSDLVQIGLSRGMENSKSGGESGESSGSKQ